jgi:hypothetical protein
MSANLAAHRARRTVVDRIEEHNRMKTLTLILALLPSMALASEQKKKPAQVTANPCAQYGAGFVQVPGTTTCVKASGSIRVDVGVQSNGR